MTLADAVRPQSPPDGLWIRHDHYRILHYKHAAPRLKPGHTTPMTATDDTPQCHF